MELIPHARFKLIVRYIIYSLISKINSNIKPICFILGAIFIICAYNLVISLVLCVVLFFLSITSNELNKFLDVNIYTGCLNMKGNVKKEDLQNQQEDLKKSQNDLEMLNRMVSGFIYAICLIPEETKCCPFRIFKNNVYVETHEVVIKIAQRFLKEKNIKYTISKTELGNKQVLEKMFRYSFKEILNLDTKRCNSLLKNKKKYKVIIEISDIKKVAGNLNKTIPISR